VALLATVKPRAWLRNGGLTDFNVDAFHVACCFGNVDVVVILRVRGKGEDLGGELEGIALGVLGLGGLASCLLERGATWYQLKHAKMDKSPYVVWK
jgi:hypothetical protein